jgi:hypothetical protein
MLGKRADMLAQQLVKPSCHDTNREHHLASVVEIRHGWCATSTHTNIITMAAITLRAMEVLACCTETVQAANMEVLSCCTKPYLACYGGAGLLYRDCASCDGFLGQATEDGAFYGTIQLGQAQQCGLQGRVQRAVHILLLGL